MERVEEGRNQLRILPKRIKLQEIAENSEDDRISALPDCLLLEILSRLPCTKDAIRTGTLSKRWKHLWTLLPTLIFEHNDKNRRWYDFVSSVDKTLSQCRQLKLEKFQVYSSHYAGLDSRVNSWIGYAISCNVEELKLMLWGIKDVFSLDQSFFINTCFTDLTLSCCILDPIGAIRWKNLRCLCIYSVKLDEAVIENILTGSPQLETLELINCFGFRRLDITSKSVKKLVLDEFFYSSQYHDTIEIKAPKMLSLTIRGCMWFMKLFLVDMSSLVEANLSYYYLGYEETPSLEAEEEMLKGFILNLRHVKKLKFGGSCSKVGIMEKHVVSRLKAKGFIFPSDIKFTEVTSDWLD